MLFQWDCRNRNPVLLIATKSSTRKQVLLLEYSVLKQPNVISMGLLKQKSSPIDSYKKFNQEASITEIVSKQHNVISMGLSKQEFCTLEYSV